MTSGTRTQQSASFGSPFFMPGDATDSEYAFIRDTHKGHWEEHRAEIEQRWQRFRAVCGDGDLAFLSDAQAHGRQRVWEMQVACMMLDMGHILHCPPKGGPDVLCLRANGRLWIEATVAGRGTGPDAVDPRREGMVVVDPDPMILRYTSALDAKVKQHGQFRNRLMGERPIVAPDDAYVIAVNASDIPNADIHGGIPDIVRAVFGLGQQQFVVPVLGTKGPVTSTWPSCTSIAKQSGTAISTTMFLTDGAPGVSAILFSSASPWTMGAQHYEYVTFVHNPSARVPLPRGALGFGREWWLDREAELLFSNR